jgi:hypothetical protein
MLESKNKDFLVSLALFVLGIYVICESAGIYKYAAKAPFNIKTLNISPGFLPLVLGAALAVLSLILLFKTIAGQKGLVASLKEQGKDLAQWFKELPKNKDFINMALGIIIMGIYSILLLKPLHFWLSSLIFLFGLMVFLHVDKIWKIGLISLGSVGAVILLFQVIFRASLP